MRLIDGLGPAPGGAAGVAARVATGAADVTAGAPGAGRSDAPEQATVAAQATTATASRAIGGLRKGEVGLGTVAMSTGISPHPPALSLMTGRS
jgi:hypothetical protein